MEANRPSLTAEGAAALRAVHQILDQPPVFEDPLAIRILGADDGPLDAVLDRYDTAEMRPLRASIAVRSRYAEDALAAAVARGVRQYVLLGAGLDTFAYRNPHADEQLRVFEVDHPATQAWKRDRLERVGIPIPDLLTFVPIDFERETLPAALDRSGFDAGAPAFFSWLGVTVYLTREAVLDTLRFVATLALGSEIAFTYVARPSSGQTRSALGARARALGEPWQTFFEPSALERDLRGLGFREVEDVAPSEANLRYLDDRADQLRVGTFGHLMRARV
jgi:methyltransferase (TIGR00027 family)